MLATAPRRPDPPIAMAEDPSMTERSEYALETLR
jgi:hypothetical protein